MSKKECIISKDRPNRKGTWVKKKVVKSKRCRGIDEFVKIYTVEGKRLLE